MSFFSWVPHDRENEKSHQMEAVMGLGIQKRGAVGVVGKPEECVSQSVLMRGGLFLRQVVKLNQENISLLRQLVDFCRKGYE